jgi:hypothetical protein
MNVDVAGPLDGGVAPAFAAAAFRRDAERGHPAASIYKDEAAVVANDRSPSAALSPEFPLATDNRIVPS